MSKEYISTLQSIMDDVSNCIESGDPEQCEAVYDNLLMLGSFIPVSIEKLATAFPECSKEYFSRQSSIPTLRHVSPLSNELERELIDRVQFGANSCLDASHVSSSSHETFGCLLQLIWHFQSIKAELRITFERANPFLKDDRAGFIPIIKSLPELNRSTSHEWSNVICDYLFEYAPDLAHSNKQNQLAVIASFLVKKAHSISLNRSCEQLKALVQRFEDKYPTGRPYDTTPMEDIGMPEASAQVRYDQSVQEIDGFKLDIEHHKYGLKKFIRQKLKAWARG